MDTTAVRDTSEAEVHGVNGFSIITDKDHFSEKAIHNLSLSDQYLFRRFGQGPITRIPYRCIHYAFEDQVKSNPNEIAICHEGESITYKELNDKAQLLALELLSQGVKKGDNVGLFIQRSIPMVIGILGILKVGAAYVPQHIGLAPEERLRYVIKSASIKVVLSTLDFSTLIPENSSIHTLFIDEFFEKTVIPNKVSKLPEFDISENEVCYIIFTSGTTGNPNGVQVTHGNLCNVLLTAPGNLGMRPGLKVGQILSISFDMSVWEILGALSNGATLMIRGKNIQETVSKVDIVICTPTILSSLDVAICKNVKVVAVAGEPCPRVLAEKWSQFSAFYNSCGPTETTIINTAQRFFHTDAILSIGTPMPNNTVYILDEKMQPCKIGEVGEMWAGGYCVSKGYINNESLTKERYLDDPFLGKGHKMFRTRDLGRWTPDGRLEHFGRTDDQVKICGFRVELDAVSSVIEKIPDCKRAVTLKLDNKTLVSFVSPKDIDTTLVKRKIEDSLPYYCMPKHIIPMKELPKTSRGKIDKQKLFNILKSDQLEGAVSKEKDSEKLPQNAIIQEEKEQELGDSAVALPNLDEIQLPLQKPYISSMWKGEKLMHYYRLFGILILVNIGIFIYGLTTGDWWVSDNKRLDILSKVALINFTIGILIRQQYVINLLFWIATSVPVHWPLSIRRRAGKVYHFGGIHIGGTVSGSLWYIAFLGTLFYDFFNPLSAITKSIPLLLITTVITGILIVMILMALPKFRAKYHNNFEKMHRFGGWTALALFWAQMVVIHKGNAADIMIYQTTNFWLLSLITISILLPWLRLKKVKVAITKPSNHVILARFNYGTTPFAGSSTAISRNPLLEWHSFANVPEPGRDGFRLTISRAGDWTGQLIDDMPSHVWVKGITTAGVGNVDKLFKKVVWVATGSGIGPCLPHLLSQEVPARLVWATRNPRKTYGDGLIDEILAVQPDAIIWNTDTHGKPDMVKLAYKVYKESDAEAVICISNKKLTWKVVYGMESRGIPAYGAIWDS